MLGSHIKNLGVASGSSNFLIYHLERWHQAEVTFIYQAGEEIKFAFGKKKYITHEG